MADTAVRYIEITTDASAALRDLNRLRGAAESTERNVNTLARSVRNLSGAFGAFLGFDLAFRLVALGDAAANLSKQLEIATGSVVNSDRAFNRLLESANLAGIAIEDMAGSFTRLSVAVPERDLYEVSAAMETVSLTIAKLGVSTQGANATLTQLIQGLAAGALQGDEFRTVNEQIPVLLRAWADAAGFAGVAVKELSALGVLTTQSFFELQPAIRASLDALLGLEPPVLTVSRAMNALRNNFIAAVRSSNSMSKGFEVLARSIKFLADNLNSLIDALTVFVGIFAVSTFARFISGLRSVETSMKSTRAATVASTASLNAWGAAAAGLSFGALTLAEEFAEVREEARRIDTILGESEEALGAWVRQVENADRIELRIAEESDIDLLARLQAQWRGLTSEIQQQIEQQQVLLSYDDQLDRERQKTENRLDQLIAAYRIYSRLIEAVTTRTKELQKGQRDLAVSTSEVARTLDEAREKADFAEVLADSFEESGEAGVELARIAKESFDAVDEFRRKLLETGEYDIFGDPDDLAKLNAEVLEYEKALERQYDAEIRLAQSRERAKEDLKIARERNDEFVRANRVLETGIAAADRYLESLRREGELAQLTNKEREIRVTQLYIEDQVTQANTRSKIAAAEGNTALADSYDQLADKWEQIKPTALDVQKTNQELAASTNAVADTLADSFSDAFGSILTDTSNWADAMNRILDNLLSDLIRTIITSPLQDALRSLFSGFDFGSLFGGGGAAVSSGGGGGGGAVAALSSGASTTAAAITRSFTSTSGGGRATGGGGVVVNVVEDTSRSGEQAQRRGPGGETVVDVFVARIKADLADDIRGGGGAISGSLEQTYGLNRATGAF